MAPPPDSNLVTLGKDVYLSKGISTPGQNGNPTDPTVIIIFGWMGAQLSHLLKYITKYDELYPGATKVIIRSEPTFFWSSQKTNEALLKPVVTALASLGCTYDSSNPPPRILVHSFSNGGAWQLTTLSGLLARSPGFSLSPKSKAAPITPTAFILDSSPGDGGLRSTILAFTTAIKNPIVRFTAATIIFFLYTIASSTVLFTKLCSFLVIKGLLPIFLFASRLVSSKARNDRAYKQRLVEKLTLRTIMDNLKSDLISETLVPFFSLQTTKRLYVYSDGDVLIPPGEIEAHAASAKARGWDVKLERYGPQSAHVSHARTDPERYWASVTDLWDSAVKACV